MLGARPWQKNRRLLVAANTDETVRRLVRNNLFSFYKRTHKNVYIPKTVELKAAFVFPKFAQANLDNIFLSKIFLKKPLIRH